MNRAKKRLRYLMLCGLLLSAACLVKPSGAQAEPPSNGKEQPKQKEGEKNKTDKKEGDDEKEPASKPLPQVSPDARYDYQGEATFILQNLFKFRSPYEGPASLPSRSDLEFTNTYTLFLGARLTRGVEVYINPELALGHGVGGGTGLAGSVNGDVIGQDDLRPLPYFARYFVRWRIPTPQRGRKGVREVRVGRALNLIEGEIPAHRIVVTAGKFGISDIFDVNQYANDPRSQFMNDAFGNNLAYDFAQETRGYALGASVAWVNPDFAVRFGTFAMPTEAGGPDLAYDLSRSHGDQLEFEAYPRILPHPRPPMTVRLLAWRNVASMGRFRDALDAATPDMPPDVTGVRKDRAVKYGYGLNFEQALRDGGATGVFGRFGWNDGQTETYNFAEADRFYSLGGQLSGVHWGRKEDIFGVAFGQSDLTSVHRDYLAAGGEGAGVGDGQLRYGAQRVLEAYYSYQLNKPLSISLDYQYITSPGYNRDRGPVSLLALRLHMTF